MTDKKEYIDKINSEIEKINISGEPKELYKLYTNILPKGKQWLKYIKGDNKMALPKWLINLVATDMKISKREAVDAIDLWMSTEGGMLELGELCKKWGVESKKIDEVGLNVLGSTGGYTAGNG